MALDAQNLHRTDIEREQAMALRGSVGRRQATDRPLFDLDGGRSVERVGENLGNQLGKIFEERVALQPLEILDRSGGTHRRLAHAGPLSSGALLSDLASKVPSPTRVSRVRPHIHPRVMVLDTYHRLTDR